MTTHASEILSLAMKQMHRDSVLTLRHISGVAAGVVTSVAIASTDAKKSRVKWFKPLIAAFDMLTLKNGFAQITFRRQRVYMEPAKADADSSKRG